MTQHCFQGAHSLVGKTDMHPTDRLNKGSTNSLVKLFRPQLTCRSLLSSQPCTPADRTHLHHWICLSTRTSAFLRGLAIPGQWCPCPASDVEPSPSWSICTSLGLMPALVPQLSTIIDMLEGAFYGVDLLKLHSVTTKLVGRVDKLEEVRKSLDFYIFLLIKPQSVLKSTKALFSESTYPGYI